MTPEQAEQLGQMADRLDAILHTTRLPLPASTHVGGLSETIRDVRDELAEMVRDATGEDPWETNPLQG